MQLLTRQSKMRVADDSPKEGNIVDVIAATDGVVDMGGYQERLSMMDGVVDESSCRSVLLNHNRSMICGAVRSISYLKKSTGVEMRASVEIDPDAVWPTGVNVLRSIRQGMVDGISIGYDYGDQDATYDQESRTLTANRWSLREITFTPTAADTDAKVIRSLPETFERKNTMTKPADADHVNELEQAKRETAAANERATIAENAREASDLARSHGVELTADEIKEFKADKVKARDLIMRKMADKVPEVKHGAAPIIEVGKTAMDKQRERAISGISHIAGIAQKDSERSDLCGAPVDEIFIRYALAEGIGSEVELRRMSRSERAMLMLGKRNARSANVTTSMFSTYVLANVFDKAVMSGWDLQGQESTWEGWAKVREVSDFKQVTDAAVEIGNLVQTAENNPFPEIAKSDVGYNSTLALWGATESLSFQTLVNDDLGQFMEKLVLAGSIAARTIEAEAYRVLEAATWTANVTASAPLATAGNMDKVRKDFRNKAGPSSTKLNLVPRNIIVPVALTAAADSALGIVVPGGQVFTASVAGTASARSRSMGVIESPYLTSDTTWYMVGDVNSNPAAKVLFLRGNKSPTVYEHGKNAVASTSYTIMLPFAVAMAQATQGAGTGGGSTIYWPGAQQATA